MTITYDKKLADYMDRKGFKHVVVELVEPGCDTASYSEVTGMLVDDEKAERYRPQARRTLHGEKGDVIIISRGIEVEEQVFLGLRSFLGLKDVTFKGIHAWKL